MIYLGIDVGIRNFSYCLLQRQAGVIRILEWRNIDLLTMLPMKRWCQIKNGHVRDVARHTMKVLFPPKKVCRTINYVVIESQPKNGKMQLFSRFILDYFQRLREQGTHQDVLLGCTFLSAKTKYNKDWVPDQKTKRSYPQRKALSCRLCQRLLQEHQVQYDTNLFLSGGGAKKDDLADSFLLALYVCLFTPKVMLKSQQEEKTQTHQQEKQQQEKKMEDSKHQSLEP